MIFIPVLLILSAAGLVLLAEFRFRRMVRAEVRTLFSQNRPRNQRFAHADLHDLPRPVRSYLMRCIPDGQPLIDRVRIKQSGSMLIDPQKPWKAFRAEEFFSTQPPGFVWRVYVRFLPGIWVSGRDRYMNQRGQMLIKLLSLLNIVNASGPAIDNGAYIRYVAEQVWFPTALLPTEQQHWQPIDDHSARLIACDGENEARLVFHFNAEGDIDHLVGENRYRDAKDPAPTPWIIHLTDYREFDGLRVPAKAVIGWQPESGYAEWWRGQIDALEYHPASR